MIQHGSCDRIRGIRHAGILKNDAQIAGPQPSLEKECIKTLLCICNTQKLLFFYFHELGPCQKYIKFRVLANAYILAKASVTTDATSKNNYNA